MNLTVEEMAQHYDKTKHIRFDRLTPDLWVCLECREIGADGIFSWAGPEGWGD